MAADFARLIRTSSGRSRIVIGKFARLIDDRRAKQIERAAQQSNARSDDLFRAPFHYYLTPFALSSKLWQARLHTPASLTSSYSNTATAPHVARLAYALNRAYRPLLTSRWLFDKSIDRIQGNLIDVTGGPDASKRRRRDEIGFRIGTMQVLSPAASDVSTLLRELTAAVQCGQAILPATCHLYAAFLLCLIHPFVDGNGRLMRALSAAHDSSACRTGTLCRALATFQQGRQRLWNFTLPLALQGDAGALWDHFDRCIHASSRLVAAIDDVALRYQEHWGVTRSDLSNPADALLVASTVLTDRQHSRLLHGSSIRIRRLAERNFEPNLLGGEMLHWTNSGVQRLVGDTASILIAQI